MNPEDETCMESLYVLEPGNGLNKVEGMLYKGPWIKSYGATEN